MQPSNGVPATMLSKHQQGFGTNNIESRDVANELAPILTIGLEKVFEMQMCEQAAKSSKLSDVNTSAKLRYMAVIAV